MGYPAQGSGCPTCLDRAKISNETWTMLVQAQTVADIKKVAKRLLKGEDHQDDEE